MDRISRCSQVLKDFQFICLQTVSLLFANDVVLWASSNLDLQQALWRECDAAAPNLRPWLSVVKERIAHSRLEVSCCLECRRTVVLFMSEGRKEQEIDRRFGAAFTAMWMSYKSVVVKRELSRKVKFWSLLQHCKYSQWKLASSEGRLGSPLGVGLGAQSSRQGSE